MSHRTYIAPEPAAEEIAQNIADWAGPYGNLEASHKEHCDALGIDPTSDEGRAILDLARACVNDTLAGR